MRSNLVKTIINKKRKLLFWLPLRVKSVEEAVIVIGKKVYDVTDHCRSTMTNQRLRGQEFSVGMVSESKADYTFLLNINGDTEIKTTGTYDNSELFIDEA